MRRPLVALYFAMAFAVSAGLNAAVISEYMNGAIGGIGSGLKLGQSLTTPSGGPWNNIQFNFFKCGVVDIDTAACSGGNIPFAFGPLFLLTQEFVGYIPPNTYPPLDSTTPGFIASTSTIVGGVWQFDNSVVLAPNTKYWFYMPENDFSFTTRLWVGNDGVAGDGYFGLVGVPGWDKFRNINFNLTGADAYFTLQGNAVPEPSQSVLLGVSLLLCIWGSKSNKGSGHHHKR